MPQKFLCTIGKGTIETIIYIIEDLGHSSGTPLKNCLGLVFFLNTGFNKESNSLGNLALSRL